MTSSTQSSGVPTRILAWLSAIACFGLGIIALYSSGIGLIDPKLHRAVGFGLALIVLATICAAMRLRSSCSLRISTCMDFPRVLLSCI